LRKARAGFAALQFGTAVHRPPAMPRTTSSDRKIERLALIVAATERAREAAEQVRQCGARIVPLVEADVVIVLGGDGTMLDAMHKLIDEKLSLPIYGLNLGTVGFLLNRASKTGKVLDRIVRARPITVAPLKMDAVTQDGAHHSLYAINEVSLLRETRQTAKIEITVNEKVRVPELSADGVLLATPVGSTAYNFSANGPILPLDSQTLALTPISPFRPRRWRGAILPDRSRVTFKVRDPAKRPVSAVADMKELRDIAEVHLAVDRERPLTLLFDPGHALDDRIVADQFAL
jgi:NAD+ kinase